MRDLSKDTKHVLSIVPAALDADNTPIVIDRQGYESVMYDIAVGVGGITFSGTNKVEFKLTHSDDDSTYTAVESDDVVITLPDGTDGAVTSGGIVRSLVAAHAAGTVTKVGYIGGKRYTSLLADFSGTHAAVTPIAAVAILGHAQIKPV